MSNVFSAQYFHKIFEINLLSGGDKSKKANHQCHLLTQYTFFEILSYEWDKVLYTVQAEQLQNVDVKDKEITISFKVNGKAQSIKISSDKPEIIKLALKTIPPEEAVFQGPFAAKSILPTMGFVEKEQINNLHSQLAHTANEFLSTFSDKIKTTEPLNDILAAIYAYRFSNKDHIEKCCYKLLQELRIRFLHLWSLAVERASLMEDNHELAIRVIANQCQTMYNVANTFTDVPIDTILAGAGIFIETNKSLALCHELAKFRSQLGAILENSRTGCQHVDVVNKLMDVFIIANSGKLIDIYPFDIYELAMRCSNIITETQRGASPDKALIEALVQSCHSIAGDMLRKMKDHRYDPLFQYVFSVWVIKDINQ